MIELKSDVKVTDQAGGDEHLNGVPKSMAGPPATKIVLALVLSGSGFAALAYNLWLQVSHTFVVVAVILGIALVTWLFANISVARGGRRAFFALFSIPLALCLSAMIALAILYAEIGVQRREVSKSYFLVAAEPQIAKIEDEAKRAEVQLKFDLLRQMDASNWRLVLQSEEEFLRGLGLEEKQVKQVMVDVAGLSSFTPFETAYLLKAKQIKVPVRPAAGVGLLVAVWAFMFILLCLRPREKRLISEAEIDIVADQKAAVLAQRRAEAHMMEEEADSQLLLPSPGRRSGSKDPAARQRDAKAAARKLRGE